MQATRPDAPNKQRPGPLTAAVGPSYRNAPLHSGQAPTLPGSAPLPGRSHLGSGRWETARRTSGPAWAGSPPPSSTRCPPWPRRPGPSTSARASPTPTARPSWWRRPSPPSRPGTTSTSQEPGSPGCGPPSAAISGPSTGSSYDPETEVLVTTGATEAIAASLLALCGEGDEVVMFEPFYDSYAACTALAGGRPARGPARAPDWSFDPDQLEAAVTARTRCCWSTPPTTRPERSSTAASWRRSPAAASTTTWWRSPTRSTSTWSSRGSICPWPPSRGCGSGRSRSPRPQRRSRSPAGRWAGRAHRPPCWPPSARSSSSSPTSSGGPFQYAVAEGLAAGDRLLLGHRPFPA